MKTYQVSRSVLRSTYDGNDTLIQSTQVQGMTDAVTNAPLSNKGNFRDPTPWTYIVNREFLLYGQHRTITTATGRTWRKVKGGLQTTIQYPTRFNRDTVYNLALSRLNDRVRGKLDLSIALAESGTTIRMIKSTLKVLNHARKLKPPGGYGSTRDVANGYLQYKYGWKPLLGDVFDAANESLRVVVNKLTHITASARLPEDCEGRTINYPIVDSVQNVPMLRNIKKGSFSGCKIGVSLEIPTSAFQLDRWMSLNPVSITWELIPYSFVVDWFVDVGSYLRNIETACLYNTVFRSGYKSEIWRVDLEDRQDNWMSGDVFGQIHHMTDIVGELYKVEFNRTRLASYPFPRRPTFKVDLSSGQMFSAAALLRQLMPDKGLPQIPGRSRPGIIR